MTEVLVYAASLRAQTARTLLGAACQATGLSVRLELYGSGSLYQRLGPRHAPPLPDVVLWFGPFAAHSAALDGLLQPYQPATIAPTAVHDRDWRWTTLDYLPIGVVGSPTGVNSLQDLTAAPGLAMADPERSEVGLSIVLATLDAARQADADVERGWTWWRQRAQNGLTLTDDDSGAVAVVGGAGVSHALSFSNTASPVPGLSPIPNAVSLAANSRNADAAKHLLDWLTSDAPATLTLSPWRAADNGLQRVLSAAPPLDIAWCRQQYTPTRRRWSQSAFGPRLTSQ